MAGMTTEPESLGVFGRAADDELEQFDKPPIPFTLVAYERIVEDPDDDVEEAELVDDDGDEIAAPPGLAGPAGNGDRLPVRVGPIIRHEEREFTFHVWPEVEFGPLFRSLKASDARGVIPAPIAVQFLADAIIPEERDEFDRVIRDYRVKASMIQELAEALAIRYGMRPTPSRSERRAGSRRVGRTSEAVHSGRVTS